jgi:hypothetical protein
MEQSPIAAHASSPQELQERLAAERDGTAFVVLRDADGAQQIHRLEDSPSRRITVGRDMATDVCVHWDPQVSSTHAELERIADDWALIDDGLSTNGTFVNGERVQGRRRLHDGDALRFGDTHAVFRSPRAAAVPRTVVGGAVLTRGSLSEAQLRVLHALCRPFKGSPAYAAPPTNQEIAAELFLSVDAVKTHLRALFEKFEVEALPQNQKRLRLIELAFQAGVVTDRDL